MDDAWIESLQHIVACEKGKVVLYAFPGVVCYKCPFCGPSSVLRTIAGQARHLGTCTKRKKMQLEMIGNPRKFKFIGFSFDVFKEMCYENDGKRELDNERQNKSPESTVADEKKYGDLCNPLRFCAFILHTF